MFHLNPPQPGLFCCRLGVHAPGALFLESGIHATISGVVLGFCVPVKFNKRTEAAGADSGLAEVFEYRFRPISTSICVPVFAFFSAGVALGGFDGLGRASPTR